MTDQTTRKQPRRPRYYDRLKGKIEDVKNKKLIAFLLIGLSIVSGVIGGVKDIREAVTSASAFEKRVIAYWHKRHDPPPSPAAPATPAPPAPTLEANACGAAKLPKCNVLSKTLFKTPSGGDAAIMLIKYEKTDKPELPERHQFAYFDLEGINTKNYIPMMTDLMEGDMEGAVPLIYKDGNRTNIIISWSEGSASCLVMAAFTFTDYFSIRPLTVPEADRCESRFSPQNGHPIVARNDGLYAVEFPKDVLHLRKLDILKEIYPRDFLVLDLTRSSSPKLDGKSITTLAPAVDKDRGGRRPYSIKIDKAKILVFGPNGDRLTLFQTNPDPDAGGQFCIADGTGIFWQFTCPGDFMVGCMNASCPMVALHYEK